MFEDGLEEGDGCPALLEVYHGTLLLGVLGVVLVVAHDPDKAEILDIRPHGVDDVCPAVVVGAVVGLEVWSEEVADKLWQRVVLLVREACVDDVGDQGDVGMVDAIHRGKEGHQCPAVRRAVWLAGRTRCGGVAAGLRRRCSCLCPPAKSRDILGCLQGEDGL